MTLGKFQRTHLYKTNISGIQLLQARRIPGECRAIDSFTWDEGVERFGVKLPSSELQSTKGLEKFRDG